MKRLRPQGKVWMICLALFSFTAGAQDTLKGRHEFSVQQAVEYAKRNSVQIKNALLGVELQKQTNREITAAAFPQINGSLSTTYNPNVAVQTFPNFIAAATYGVLAQEDVRKGNGSPIIPPADFGLIEAQFGTRWFAGAGVDLSQLLFDGQVFVGLQARKTSIDFQQKNVEVTEEQLKANIHKVYYQLVASKTQIELLDANLDRVNKLLHDTREIFKNGFAEKLDVDKLSVQLANLQTEKLKALNGIQNGYIGLKFLIGMPVRDTLVLTDTLNYEEIREGILENSTYQYSDRKEFQYAELGKKLREYNVRRYKLSKIPTVSLTSAYYKNAQRNRFDFYKGPYFTTSSVSLRINVPIFNGFVARARVQKSQIELQQAVNEMDALKLSIDNDVEQAKSNFNSAVATLDFQKKNMELAEQVYNQTRKKYEAGLGSNLEISSAQSELRIAQASYIRSLYDAIIARIDFLKATGKL
jgi:outer membrane protein